MDKQIVKIQYPIVGNEVMVYNEDKSLLEMFPLTNEIKKIFKGRMKVYYTAHTSDDGYLELDDEQKGDFDW